MCDIYFFKYIYKFSINDLIQSECYLEEAEFFHIICAVECSLMFSNRAATCEALLSSSVFDTFILQTLLLPSILAWTNMNYVIDCDAQFIIN